MYFIDTEGTSLYGMAVLIQYAKDNGEICLFSPWTNPIRETLTLIESFVEEPDGLVFFNAAFDWFHLCKLYTTFSLAAAKLGYNIFPEDHLNDIAYCEKEARDGPCLKPQKVLDLMLHARKGPYQSTMNRADIRIRRVPKELAWELAAELDKRIPMKDIYFARSKTKRVEKWVVYDIEDKETGDLNPDFKDIVCKFSPSTALKALAMDALGVSEDNVVFFDDVAYDDYSKEVGWAPYALAVGEPGNWNGAWPEKIKGHISHWNYYAPAREYAKNDIVYTRGLYKYFGCPPVDDHDSVLACCVAAVRWRGYRVDLPGITTLREEALALSKKVPTAPGNVVRYFEQVADPAEMLQVYKEGTGKVILEALAEMREGVTEGELRPIALRAREVLSARKATNEVKLYDKLLQAGRFHASFVVIGTKSSRMSGTDKLNPQGINHSKKVRSRFPLAWHDLCLCGGDFSSFEVSLAASIYNDPILNADLAEGNKMAGLFGEAFFPGMSYDEILESEGDEDDFYDKSKRGMYAFFYFGNEMTLENRIGIDIETGKAAIELMEKRYPGIGEARKRIISMFCSMTQPGGLGTQVVWKDPADYIESPLGFRRYFTLENRVCKALFELANKPPEHWKNIKIKVVRRDRTQTASGATQSALYAAAFQLQAANLRAAGNHEIQCFGAQITKAVQVEVWSFQPSGITKWYVMPANIHDEVLSPCLPEIKENIKTAVDNKVNSFKNLVPMLKMKWELDMSCWKGKT